MRGSSGTLSSKLFNNLQLFLLSKDTVGPGSQFKTQAVQSSTLMAGLSKAKLPLQCLLIIPEGSKDTAGGTASLMPAPLIQEGLLGRWV